jgi:hypothetical protein
MVDAEYDWMWRNVLEACAGKLYNEGSHPIEVVAVIDAIDTAIDIIDLRIRAGQIRKGDLDE